MAEPAHPHPGACPQPAGAPPLIPRPQADTAPGCLLLIGMPGSGKSALGRALAAMLNLAHLDTDALIEAHYAMRLQAVTDLFGKAAFIELESAIVGDLKARHAVISTGGSVVYSPQAMQHLKTLGPVIWLDVSLPVLLERVRSAPDRGIAIAPGETYEDLYRQRLPLYRRYADFTFRPLDQGVADNARDLWRAWETAQAKDAKI